MILLLGEVYPLLLPVCVGHSVETGKTGNSHNAENRNQSQVNNKVKLKLQYF